MWSLRKSKRNFKYTNRKLCYKRKAKKMFYGDAGC